MSDSESDPDNSSVDLQANEHSSKTIQRIFEDVSASGREQRGIRDQLNAVSQQLQFISDQLDFNKNRQHNPLAALLPLDLHLRNANQNQTGGAMSMTISAIQPQPQTQQNSGQVPIATPSTSGQAAIAPGLNQHASPPDNVNRPAAFVTLPSSRKSTATQDQDQSLQAESSSAAQHRISSSPPVNDTQITEDEKLARRLQQQEYAEEPSGISPRAEGETPEDELYSGYEDEEKGREKIREGKKTLYPNQQQSQKNRSRTTMSQGGRAIGPNKETKPPNTVGKPAAFPTVQFSAKPNAAQKQKQNQAVHAGSSRAAQNISSSPGPTVSFVPASNVPQLSDELIAQDMQDMGMNGGLWSRPAEATSRGTEEEAQELPDDGQAQHQKSGYDKQARSSNQQSQPGGKGSAGNSQTSLYRGGNKDSKKGASSEPTGNKDSEVRRSERAGSEAKSTQGTATKTRKGQGLRNLVAINKERAEREASKPAGEKPGKPGWEWEELGVSPKNILDADPEPRRRSRAASNKPTTKTDDQTTIKDSKEPEKTVHETAELEDPISPATSGSADNSVRPPSPGAGGDPEPDDVPSSGDDGPDSISPDGPAVRRIKRKVNEDDQPEAAEDMEDDTSSPPKKQKQGTRKGKATLKVGKRN